MNWKIKLEKSLPFVGVTQAKDEKSALWGYGGLPINWEDIHE